jgi:hypothetical protein
MRNVAVFGCPRSGTSWLGQILNASEHVAYRYQPLFSYEFKDWFGRHGVDARSVADFHAAISQARSDFVLQDLKPAKGALTHLAWKEVRYHALMAPLLACGGLDRLVYIVRDPVDVINSWYLAPKEFRAGQDIRAEWRDAPSKNVDASEFNGFEKWKASLRMARELRARHPGRFLVVSYERLRADPHAEAAALFEAIGLPFTAQAAAFVAASTSRHDGDAYGVFRDEPTPIALPPDIVAAIRADEEARRLLVQVAASQAPQSIA